MLHNSRAAARIFSIYTFLDYFSDKHRVALIAQELRNSLFDAFSSAVTYAFVFYNHHSGLKNIHNFHLVTTCVTRWK